MNSFTIFVSSALMPKQLWMPLPGKNVLGCMLEAIYHCIDCTLYQMYIGTLFQNNGQHKLVMTNKLGDYKAN